MKQTVTTPNNDSPIQPLLNYIDASPSPWHAVSTTVEALELYGFEELDEQNPWQLENNGKYYIVRDQSSIIAFITGDKAPSESGYRIIGAHTDSPGLRIKPRPISESGPWLRLGVEVYGGPTLATFADRDLSLAGRVSVKTGKKSTDFESRLIKFDQSLFRLVNLPIHLNRGVNDTGLKFNQQTELPLTLTLAPENQDNSKYLHQLLANALSVKIEAILSWELAVYDTQKGAVFGPNQEFYANSQLDNLASCHSALSALLEGVEENNDHQPFTRMIALFDHEEVGSRSAKGADGSFLEDSITRIGQALGDVAPQAQLRSRAKSFMISADMAHAFHPNYADKYDNEHLVIVNAGPVIKINRSQRYSSHAQTEALFMNICQNAQVPYQLFVNRSDLACGSTIGPMSAAKTGIPSLDIGNPMWAMHSIRESAGVLDHHYMHQALSAFLKKD